MNTPGSGIDNPLVQDMDRIQDVFHQDHREQRRELTITRKGGYTAAVQNIHGIPSTPPGEHHKAI